MYEILKNIGAVGGILFLIYFVIQRMHAMYNWLFPLKIKVLGTACYEYNYEKREYIVIVREVEVHIRRQIVTKAKCLQLKGDKHYYPSAEGGFRVSDNWDQSYVHNMRFATEIYDEEALRNKRVIRGRIILGRHKSKYFPINEIKAIREGDRIISNET